MTKVASATVIRAQNVRKKSHLFALLLEIVDCHGRASGYVEGRACSDDICDDVQNVAIGYLEAIGRLGGKVKRSTRS